MTPACVECHDPKSFDSGALIEGALPLPPASVRLHVHEHLLSPIFCRTAVSGFRFFKFHIRNPKFKFT